MRRPYYLVASSDLCEGRTGFPYPYKVYVCFDPLAAGFQRGEGHYFSGGHIPLRTFADDHEFLRGSGGTWLAPFIGRLIAGEELEAEVIEEFHKRHGRDPEIEYWWRDPADEFEFDKKDIIDDHDVEPVDAATEDSRSFDFKDLAEAIRNYLRES